MAELKAQARDVRKELKHNALCYCFPPCESWWEPWTVRGRSDSGTRDVVDAVISPGIQLLSPAPVIYHSTLFERLHKTYERSLWRHETFTFHKEKLKKILPMGFLEMSFNFFTYSRRENCVSEQKTEPRLRFQWWNGPVQIQMTVKASSTLRRTQWRF